MKKIVIMLVLALMPVMANAGYFSFMDYKHPQVNTGTSIGADYSRVTTMLAIVEHNAANGYFLIPGINWVPLAAGGGFKGGQFHIAAGPSVNMLPAIQSVFYVLVDAITPVDEYLNLKLLLKPAEQGGKDITGAFGVNMEYDFTQGRLDTPIFIGASWKF